MSRRVVRTKNRWTVVQLEFLVAAWEKHYQHLKTGRGHEEIYEMIVEDLKKEGCSDANVKQVRGRIHNLSGKFRKEASEVLRTGIPSQWSLYSKIARFFEYTAPVRFKNLGPPVYDMSEYLDLDLVMAETIERDASNRKRKQREYKRQFELEENSLDIEYEEVEPDEDSVDVHQPDQEEYSDAAQYEDENTVDEFPDRKDAEPARSSEEHAEMQEQSEPEQSVPKQSDQQGSDLDTVSFIDDDERSIVKKSKKQSNQVFHFKSSFRQAVIEDFLSQLYSNQLYADVMLITCHEGVTCVMPAHRMVLANFSEFFSNVLGALKPNTNGNPLTVCLQPDISQPVMQLLLQFMYTGKASVAEDLMGDFLQCAHILRIRGVWSEEVAEFADERNQQPPSEAGGMRNTTDDDVGASSAFDEERSSTSSPVTVIALSQNDSTNDTDERSERSRKRRKKWTKKAKKPRHQSDQESVKSEVSSDIGYDLLRSDTENEDNKREENDEQAKSEKDTDKTTENNTGEEVDGNGHDDDKDLLDEDDLTVDEEDEDEDFGTEYIDTDFGSDTDFDMGSIVDGDSVSTVSFPAAITPDPGPEPTSEPETISEMENINHNDRIEQNGIVNGCSPHDVESQKSSPVYEEERLEPETPVTPVKPIVKVQAATKPPNIRRTLQPVPSTATRIQQAVLKQPKSQTPHSSRPERRTSQQSYAIQSTSRSHLQLKVRSVYSCKICGARFNTSDGWVEHVVYTHSNGEQLMDEENNADGHITMLQCDLCNKYLGSEYVWVHHILKKHTERYPHFHEELSMSDE